jgi:hypothetical protein
MTAPSFATLLSREVKRAVEPSRTSLPRHKPGVEAGRSQKAGIILSSFPARGISWVK